MTAVPKATGCVRMLGLILGVAASYQLPIDFALMHRSEATAVETLQCRK